MMMRGAKLQRPGTPDGNYFNFQNSFQLMFVGADPEKDPLKWVEENIQDIEEALPVIDSEEEEIK